MRKIKEWFQSRKKLTEKVKALEMRLGMLERKVEEMDKFVQSARDLQVKKNLGIDEKKKWLRGYPDQTKKEA
jgi:DNA-directed RNA polymerase sigma subunit (sigma70/sigma32)